MSEGGYVVYDMKALYTINEFQAMVDNLGKPLGALRFETSIDGVTWSNHGTDFNNNCTTNSHIWVGGQARYLRLTAIDPGLTPELVSVRIWATSVTPITFPILDRSAWSGLQPKNGPGDPRECPTTACANTQGHAGDPINTRTGGFDYTWVDLSLPTTAGPLVFQRTYASPVTDTYTTTLGYGWTHNMDTRLITPTMPGGEPNVIWFKAHSANQYRFTDNGNGTYTPYNGVLASLTASTTPTTTYTLTDSAQAVYTFDWAGKLTNWKDPQNHQFNYLYDLTTSRLLTVTEPISQRYLSFQYTDQQNPNRLTSVRDHTGRHVDFGYNAAGDLTSVIDVLGQTWAYTYDSTHRLTDIKDPNDTTIPTLHIDYDASGRAWRHSASVQPAMKSIAK